MPGQIKFKSWQLLTAWVVVSISLVGFGINELAIAQRRISPNEAWRLVYEQIPDLPKENQYISKETGKVAESNTLVSRIMGYHLYVKGRTPNYRLDWKMTLADYLGVNEVMYDSNYPGSQTLRKNPLDGDRAVIARLNRRQRDALVQALVNVFNPNSQNTPTSSPNNQSQPQQEPANSIRPQSPQRGGAELLK